MTTYAPYQDGQCMECGTWAADHLCPPDAYTPHTWTGLMAGFTPPAVADRNTTNSGDTGGPTSEEPA
jgi:hypothetical protein